MNTIFKFKSKFLSSICLSVCLVLILTAFAGCSEKLEPIIEPIIKDFSKNGSGFDKTKISSSITAANTQFAFKIFRELSAEDAGKNIFISPLSISTALSMTYLGAASDTKTAMADTLEYTGIADPILNESYKNLIRYLQKADDKIELNIGNSIWIRDGQQIKETFLSANKDYFNASVASLDFSKAEAADQINNWISKATKNKINKMVESPIPGDIMMYLINAIYFKGDWATKFDSKNTFVAPFHEVNGASAQVNMMSRYGKVEYGQGEDFKAVRLPYGKGKAAMYCVLPNEQTPIDQFIAGLSPEKWNIIIESIAEREDVQLRLPRFKMEYGIKDLSDSLKALGMEIAFSDSADFSGIREGLAISRVLHKAVIEVDEEGSKAAAATVVVIRETAAAEPLIFNADRPFIFIIADDETGTILFIGIMNKVDK